MRKATLFAVAAFLMLSATISRAVEIVPFGSSWSYLNPQNGIDPAIADPDFNTTWHLPTTAFNATYNGPAFAGPSPALLGYGAINFGPIATDIGTPPSGSRYSAYFRQDFTAAQAFSNVEMNYLLDDGGVLYLDGAEVLRINYNNPVGKPDNYLTLTDGVGNEDARTTVAFPIPVTAGPHTLAFSMHQTGNTSSDMGLDIRLQDVGPPVADFGIIAPNASTGFTEAPIGATSFTRGAGQTELSFTGGGATGVQNFAAGQAYLQNNSGMILRSELIDLRGIGAVTASIDVRTFEDSGGSDFEAVDRLRVFAEVSTDGLTFTPLDIVANRIGGAAIGDPADQLKPLDQGAGAADGPFTNFSVTVPANIETMRFVIDALNNSASERFVYDNLSVQVSGGGGNFAAAVSAVPPTGATVSNGQTIAVSNAAIVAPDTRDAATLGNLAVTGIGFSQTGLVNGAINAGETQTGTVQFAKNATMLNGPAYGKLSYDISAPAGATGTGAYSYILNGTVSGNTGNGSSIVPAGQAYTGLSSTSGIPTVGANLPSVATILGGNNTSAADKTIATVWRARTAAELPPGTHPLLPEFANSLTSDVVNLTGPEGTLFALQMNYNPGDLQQPDTSNRAIGHLFLASLNPNNVWDNAIAQNTGANTTNASFLNFNGSYANFLAANGGSLSAAMLGAWGVDTAADTVWAVLNHSGNFASVPEPSSILLGSFGLLGLVFGAIRRRQTA